MRRYWPALGGWSATGFVPAPQAGKDSMSIALLEVVSLSGSMASAPLGGASPVRVVGSIKSVLLALAGTVFASGESAAIQLLHNGAPVGPVLNLTSSSATGVTDESASYPGILLSPGDTLSANIAYTPGSSPASPTLSLSVTW